MGTRIIRHDSADLLAVATTARAGGKTARLAQLGKEGLGVPPWLCITSEVFGDLTEEGLEPADRQLLLEAFDALFPAGARVAVRSSAAAEDSARASFAGQLDTYLYVTRETLEARVRDCFASAFNRRAVVYRQTRGLEESGGVAVLVQEMVDSAVSGVLFTANPTTGARDEAVLTAGLGLGEGVVSDQVETDTWFLDLASGAVRRRVIQEKRSRVVRDTKRLSGTAVESVSPACGNPPALREEQILALCRMGRTIQELSNDEPQDIEWAIDAQGAIHLLQARPITTLERESVFDNSNIVESYPGLSSPLTYSFARYAYEQTFREGSRTFGVPESIIVDNWHVHANLLGLIDGRIYYNILSWYDMFLLVRGFENYLPAWERALGLPPRFVRRNTGPKRRLLKLKIMWRAVKHYWHHDRNVARFQAMFEAEHLRFAELDLDELGAHELFELYERLGRKILAPYAISLINDFFAQQSYDKVGKLITRWGLGDADDLRNSLLCGEQDMDSVEPVRSILALVDRIRKDPSLRADLEQDVDPAEVWASLRSHADFKGAADQHLERYGDRTLHELKLETPPAGEDPAFLVTMLRNYLRGGQDLASMEARERTIRKEAEARVAKGLRGHPIRRRIFGWYLNNARRTVRYRENLRLSRSRAFGMIKRIFRALGRIFAQAELLKEPSDVFWLTVEEVGAHVRGHAVTRDLPQLVARRRQDYAGFRDSRLASRVITQGVVYRNAFTPAPEVDPAARNGVLSGTGCSPGRVRARAKVILSPEADLRIDGEILVSPMTDPGWVYLMVAAGGLVVEKGSMLSHTAIIGRELGIPTIVGVKNATQHIATGRLLEIDGQTGRVELLEDPESDTA